MLVIVSKTILIWSTLGKLISDVLHPVNLPSKKRGKEQTKQSFVKMAVSSLSSLETDENEDKYGS